MSEFTEALCKARKDKNMLKIEVANLFGWTPMYYGRYENGYLIPREYNYKKFADFIGITEKALIEMLKRDELAKKGIN